MKSKVSVPLPTIAAGQVWRMEETTCLIGEVGKRLVHYKLFNGKPARMPSTLGNKEVLAKHLRTKRAVLVQA